MAQTTPNTPAKRPADGDQTSPPSRRKKVTEAPKFGRRMITVIVGSSETQEAFDIHEDLITTHSDFFKAAMSNDWKEFQDRIVRLPEQNSESFETFIRFLYTGCIYSSKDGDRTESQGEDFTSRDEEWVRLAKLWKLGQSIMSTSFKDAITDALISKLKDGADVPVGMYRGIYPASPQTAGVRKLLVDIAVWGWHPKVLQAQRQKASLKECADFFLDLAVALDKIKITGRQGEAPYLKQEDFCGYHDHEAEGKPCYRTIS